MSFILDALKKSDNERQQQAGPALFEVRRATPRRGLPTWALVLGGLLLVNLVALGWFVARSRTAAPVPAATAAPIVDAVPAPPPATQAPVVALAVPPPRVLPPGSAATPGATPAEAAPAETVNPADYEEALPRASARAPQQPAGTVTEGEFAPTIDQLPATIRSQLPPLHLDMLVYATRASDRFVLVNMQRLREGDATREGVRVEEIRAAVVVMSYRGTRFLLERD